MKCMAQPTTDSPFADEARDNARPSHRRRMSRRRALYKSVRCGGRAEKVRKRHGDAVDHLNPLRETPTLSFLS